MVETELIVKIASGGASKTIGDVAKLQKALGDLGKNTKDTSALAAQLGKAFDLDPSEVEDLAKALGQAKKETDQLAKSAGGLGNIFQGVFQGIGQQLTKIGFDALNASLNVVGGTIKSAIGEFERFELALVSFDAKSTASQEQIKRIGDQAKELAAVTSQSPAGVAELATALLTLGATADEVETNLRGITLLADVLGEDPVLTGQVVQTGLNIFGEFGETADSLSDKLNFLVNNSAAGAQQGLSEFFQLFADVGGIVGATGAEFDDLAASFAVLRGGGASASIASTGIKTALLALSGPTTQATAELESLGVSAFDNNGEFIGLGETLEQFQGALAGLSEQRQLELATTIFGREGAPAFLAGVKEASGDIATLREQLGTQADGSLAESLEVLNQALIRQSGLLQGNIEGALTSFGEALAPVKLAAVQFANDLIASTTEASGGFDGLTEAGTRLGAVLQGNPALAEALGAAFADLFDTAIDQFAQVIDAITAFVSTEGNIEVIANQLSLVGDAIVAVGQAARFLIALADGVGQLVSAAGDLPVVGDNFERFLKFPTPLNLLAEAIKGIAEVFGVLVGVVVEGAGTAVEAVGRVFPVLQPLLDRVLQLLDLIGREPEATAFESLGIGATGAGAAIATLEETMGSVGAAIDKLPQKIPTPVVDPKPVEDGLKRITDANKAATDSLSTDAANARAAILEAGGDPAQLAQVEAEVLRDRIQNNKDFLTELEALQAGGGLSTEDAAAVADQIRGIEGQLANDRVSLAQQVLSEKQRTEKAAAEAAQKAAEAAAKAETDALKTRRDAEKEAAEGTNAERSRKATEAFAQGQRDRQEDFAESERDRDKANQQEIEGLQEASQQRLQARQKAFDEAQEAAAAAFEARQNQQRDQGNREFDALGSEVDRRLQLAQADAEGRKELTAQFAEERKTLELRRQIEKEVLANRGAVLAADDLTLSPLEQARADFEARLQAEAAAFQAGQNEEKEAFEIGLTEQRKADEAEIAAIGEAQEEAKRQRAKDFAEAERQIDATFEQQQRDIEAAFKANQRSLDEASAQQIAAILAAARPASIDGARRDGGPVKGGSSYLVGESGPELVRFGRSGHVYTARETARLMSGVPVGGRGLSVASVGGTGKLESQMAELLKEVKRGRKVQAGPTSFTLNTQSPTQDAIAIQLGILRQVIAGGGL